MVNSLSANNFNLSIVPQAPSAPVGSNPPDRTPIGKPVTRTLPPLKQYNPETKMSEEIPSALDGASKPKKEAKKTDKAAKEDKPEATDKTKRHADWKAAQEAKKAQAAQAKTDKQVKNQALALDFMRQGNFHKAAEALGTTVPELLALTQNAALGLAQEPKKLSPEEQRAKDEADYRASTEQKIKEHEQFKYQVVADNYIRENINPVLSDVEKYPLLNKNKDNLPRLKAGIYDFLNKHYVETGEVLSIGDILDTLEAQTEAAAKQSLEELKGIKKFESYFARQEREEAEAQAEQEEEVEEPEEETETPEEEPEEDWETHDAPNVSSVTSISTKGGQKVPFALLSEKDKLKAIAESRKAQEARRKR
jgi:hypothetical protein